MIAKLTDTVGGAAIVLLMPALGIGGLYWLWLSIQFGSFVMFALGLLGPVAIITAPIGFYSLLFGPPAWLLALFGP